ncbi:DNA primase DnaG [Candidatus Marsarchaeota archaeon]|nr:DNA primase DnaG [Candidatus Marsarchaeota archaeon]
MGKKYIDIVKYIVESDFSIDGNVDKPDIIGAIFGQTEGLIGADLDLRELQRNGKIGRIEIEFSNNKNNQTSGKLFLPSSLGRVETCILGAAIESVDRVGPFETSFKTIKVEDTRNEKRKMIIERAKNLIKALLSTEIPDSREISDMVESDVKTSTITVFGSENLPAGPDVGKTDEIILVEGRADVLNLIKSDITNCIAVGGASNKVPDSIIKLTTEKETTLFVDGDRGGEMIIKILLNSTDIDFVAKAPDGKEVEELTRKEIIKALHSKIPIDQIINRIKREDQFKNNNEQQRYMHQRNRFHYQTNNNEINSKQPDNENSEETHHAEYNAKTINEKYNRDNKNTTHQDSDTEIIKSVTEIVNNLHNKEDNQTLHETRHLKIMDINDDEDADIPTINNETRHISEIGTETENNKNDQGKENKNTINQDLVNTLKDLQNSLRGRLYDKNFKIIQEIPIRQLIQAVQDAKNIYAIAFDGIITQRLVELANKYNVRQLYGLRAQITKKYNNILIYTSENGVI